MNKMADEKELERLHQAHEDLEQPTSKPPKERSKLEQVLGGLILLAAIAVIAAIIFLIYNNLVTNRTTDNRQVNEDVNPCDNFYQYACSRYPSDSFTLSYQFAVKKGKEVIGYSEKSEDSEWTKLTKRIYSRCIEETKSSTDSSSIVSYLKIHAEPLLQNKPPPKDKLQGSLRSYITDKFLGSPSPSDVKVRHYKYYFKYMTKILTLLGATPENAKAVSEMVIDFERKTAMRFEVSNYKSFLHRVENSTSNILQRVDKDIGLGANIEFRVVIDPREIVYEWIDSLDQEPGYHYFLLWNRIDELVPVMPYEFRKTLAIFATDDPKDVPFPDPDEACYNITAKTVNFEVADMIVRQVVDERTKSALDEMIQRIRDEFENFVKSASKNWLGQDALEDVLEKANNVKIYSNFAHSIKTELFDESDLNNITNVLRDPTQDRFMHYFLTAEALVTRKKNDNSSREKEIFREGLSMDLTVANAGALKKGIMMFAGVLMPPFFDTRRPSADNYGGLGAIVAHELVHSLQLIKRDALLTPDGAAYWKSLRKCLKEQYDGRVQLGVRHAYVPTTVEDHADHGGVIIAYNAYINNTENTKKSDESSTEGQKRFFVAYAQNWCEDASPSAPTLMRHMDIHSQARYRANIPLSNFPPFSQVMGCSAGAAMNYDDSCLSL